MKKKSKKKKTMETQTFSGPVFKTQAPKRRVRKHTPNTQEEILDCLEEILALMKYEAQKK